MQTTVLRSTLLAAAVGFSSLAFAATAAQATDMPPSASSSAPMQQSTPQPGMQGSQSGMHHGLSGHGRHDDMRMLQQLDLTATQRSNIEQLMRQDHEQAQPQMQALMQKRMAFENAAPGSAGYQTATEQLAQAEAEAAQARVMHHAAMRTQIYNQLTPQQRTKLASLQSEHQTKMQQWRSQRAQRAVHKGAQAAPTWNSRNPPMPASTSGNAPMSGATSGGPR